MNAKFVFWFFLKNVGYFDFLFGQMEFDDRYRKDVYCCTHDIFFKFCWSSIFEGFWSPFKIRHFEFWYWIRHYQCRKSACTYFQVSRWILVHCTSFRALSNGESGGPYSKMFWPWSVTGESAGRARKKQ